MVRSPIPGVALDMLFLVALQGAAVIVIGKFLHLFLRRYNQPSAVSQILVRPVLYNYPPPRSRDQLK